MKKFQILYNWVMKMRYLQKKHLTIQSFIGQNAKKICHIILKQNMATKFVPSQINLKFYIEMRSKQMN